LLNGDLKANLTLYYNELSDFQALEFTGTQFQTFNVADVTAKGVELELAASLSDYISANLNVNYTDAQFGDDCAVGATAATAATVQQFCGFALGNAPKWVGVFGSTYDGPLTGGWSFLANMNLRYESDRRTGVGTPVSLGTQDANIKVNARIGFTEPSERFTVEFWGTNLTNEITRSISFNTALIGNTAFANQGISAFLEEPRTYGVTLRGKF